MEANRIEVVVESSQQLGYMNGICLLVSQAWPLPAIDAGHSTQQSELLDLGATGGAREDVQSPRILFPESLDQTRSGIGKETRIPPCGDSRAGLTRSRPWALRPPGANLAFPTGGPAASWLLLEAHSLSANFTILPGSFLPNILNVARQQNVGVPGGLLLPVP